MYEPLTSSCQSSSFVLRVFDNAVERFSGFFINKFPDWFSLYSSEYKIAIKSGYIMNSPHERPVDISLIEKFCRKNFEIIEVKGYHLYSLGFAMQSMNLKIFFREIYSIITVILYMFDKLFLSIFGWRKFSRPQRFILCSIKLIRK